MPEWVLLVLFFGLCFAVSWGLAGMVLRWLEEKGRMRNDS